MKREPRPDLAAILDVTIRKDGASRMYRIARSSARDPDVWASTRYTTVRSIEDVATLLADAQAEIAQLRSEGWTVAPSQLRWTVDADGRAVLRHRDLDNEP